MAVPVKASAPSFDDTDKAHGLTVTSCRYDYDDIIEILRNKNYKTLILQFITNTANLHPVFNLLSYAGTAGSYKRHELTPIDEHTIVSKDNFAIMGNNVLVLDKLREMAYDSANQDYYKFKYVRFTPKIQYTYSGHIVFDVELDPSVSGVSFQTTNPCPPSCPRPPSS